MAFTENYIPQSRRSLPHKAKQPPCVGKVKGKNKKVAI